MTDELDFKIRDVVGRLSMLSEVGAAGYEPRATKGAAESSVPRGVADKVNLQLAADRPPRKDDDLAGWWRWKFAEAVVKGESEFELHRLVLLAERDYLSQRFHSPDRMALRSGELTDNDAIDGGVAERVAAERVVELFEGMPAAEVAVHEYATEEWVKKARRQLGRQPQDGRKRAEFLDWPEDRRHREVATLAGRGLGLTKAAHRLGVDKNTVKRYFPPALPAAA